ncbi:zincin-like metallopeptidase domain-containing protein [Methylorubrum suomiense]
MFKLLCDPAQAASGWSKPWSGARVNTKWEDAPELDRLATVERVGVLVLGPGHKEADPELVAAYDRRIDGVLMPPRSHFPSQAAYYATLMHELAHWTAHPSRLGRTLGRRGFNASETERQAYAREEVVAEATAMIVLAELGHQPAIIGPHALYLQTWLGRTSDPKQTLIYAMNEAQKASSFILGGR